jgi:hypothetical protein
MTAGNPASGAARNESVDPSARRLAWMLDNAHRLAPRDGRRRREYHQRVIANPHRDAARQLLARGDTGIPPRLKLEGPSHADCLIETDRAVIWIEGKRNDWLSPATTIGTLTWARLTAAWPPLAARMS